MRKLVFILLAFIAVATFITAFDTTGDSVLTAEVPVGDISLNQGY
jgi:hypothetical protein